MYFPLYFFYFKSQLSYRTQPVKCDARVAKSLPVEVGVPQGYRTVLGLYYLLFLSKTFRRA